VLQETHRRPFRLSRCIMQTAAGKKPKTRQPDKSPPHKLCIDSLQSTLDPQHSSRTSNLVGTTWGVKNPARGDMRASSKIGPGAFHSGRWQGGYVRKHGRAAGRQEALPTAHGLQQRREYPEYSTVFAATATSKPDNPPDRPFEAISPSHGLNIHHLAAQVS
jgi:hypothetical protein